MPGTRLYVKFMVSMRCKLVVEEALAGLGLKHAAVELGMVDVLDEISDSQREEFRAKLRQSGLELLDDKRSIPSNGSRM
jgi:hypothetical protein